MQVPEDLAARVVQILGLQDPAINPGSRQMFPNGRRAESGNPKQIPQFFDGQCFESFVESIQCSRYQPRRI
jgi:hypothetical protein